MGEPGLKIFLSYSREDVAFARELRDWLLDHGHEPWMDLFDIPAGARWPSEIDRALKSSDVIIGLISPAAVASENVMNEWDWTIANDRRLILLLIEECDIPFHYVSRSYIECIANLDTAYAELQAALSTKQEVQTQQRTAGVSQAVPAGGLTDRLQASATATRGSRLRRALDRHRGPPLIIGRVGEQSELSHRLSRSRNGEGGLILLGGEAGIGKTTLVRWLQGDAAREGMITLVGNCYDLAATPPYGPWIEVLQSYQPTDVLPPIPTQMRDETAIESFASQASLFEAVGEFFAEIGEHRPLLIVLEDLHWADPASLEFLRFFARYLAGLPIIVVATYREDELTRRHRLFELMPILSREAGAKRLHLSRLDQDGIREIVTARFSIRSDDLERLVAYLGQLTGGNPFFVVELLESFVEQDVLSLSGERWHLGQFDDLRVPPLVREVIESRLSRLDAEIREALEVAAVIGQTVPLDLWSAVTELSEERMIAALESAVDARVLEDAEASDAVVFSHALIRETLYEGIVLLRRRMLHRRVGEILEKTRGADPDEVAHHFRQAGDRRAIEWLLQAAERAERRYSWIMASARFEAALHMLGDDERRKQDRGWLLMHIGRLLRFSRRDFSLLYFDEALQIASQVNDLRLTASVLWLMGITHIIDGNPALGIDEKERALEALDALVANSDSQSDGESEQHGSKVMADLRLMPWLDRELVISDADTILGWATLSAFMTMSGQFERGSEVRARVEQSDSAEAQYISQHGHSLKYAVQGRPVEARKLSMSSERFYREIEHHVISIAILTQHLIAIHLPYFTDDLEERKSLLDTAYQGQDRSSSTVGYGPLGRGLHLVHYYEGKWAEAEASALQTLESRAPKIWRPLASATAALLAHHRGDDRRAWEIIRDGFPDPEASAPGQSQYLNALCLVRAAAEIAVDTEDPDRASIWIERLGVWLDYTDAVLYRAEEQLFWARYHHIQGERQGARRRAEEALARAAKPRQPLAQIVIHRFIGQLDVEETSYVSAEKHLRRSRELAETCRLPFELAQTLIETARLRLATGDYTSVRQLLLEIQSICEPIRARSALVNIAEVESVLETTNG